MQIVVAESQCWLDLWLTLSRGKAIRAMSLPMLPRSLNLPKEPGAAASACLELKGGTNLTTLTCHFLDVHRQMSTSAYHQLNLAKKEDGAEPSSKKGCVTRM